MPGKGTIASHLPPEKLWAKLERLPGECKGCRKAITWQQTPGGKWIAIDLRTHMPHVYACQKLRPWVRGN